MRAGMWIMQLLLADPTSSDAAVEDLDLHGRGERPVLWTSSNSEST